MLVIISNKKKKNLLKIDFKIDENESYRKRIK